MKLTTFLILFLLHVLKSSSLTPDGILLLSFKYSLLGDPNSILDSWNYQDDTPCSWFGVTCSTDTFNVVTLLLPGSQLLGSISPDLGSIPHLHHLDLSNNFFNGSIPDSIFNASELQVISLSNNLISGELPELIGGLKTLQVFNISDNAFAGKVPESLGSLDNLTVVSLSSNYFTGSIPTGFNSVRALDLSSNLFNGSLPIEFGGENLHYLNVSYNKLAGKIPPEFAKRVSKNATFDLSNNNLSGEIPELEVLQNQNPGSFSGNTGLCGKPLKSLCSVPSTLSLPPNITSSPTISTPAIAAIPKNINPNTLPNTPSQNQDNGLKAGSIIGIIIGDLMGIGIIAVVFFYVYQLRKKKKNDKSTEEIMLSSVAWPCMKGGGGGGGGGDTSEFTTGSDTDSEERSRNEGIVVSVDGESRIELETLLKAAAYVLGTNGRSIVYKAVVEDGREFAVRRIGESGGGEKGMREFENQVRGIAKLRHPNLVRVRGFYWGIDEKLVIYDYVSNGSLAAAIHRKSGSSLHISLEVRLKIARGVARGLQYIHDKKHVHANIKPSNILLDHNMEPIITDLGIDRLISGGSAHDDHPTTTTSGGSTTVAASPYRPPESLTNPKSNPKWDVYAFGMVLLELLTGKVLTEWELGQWGGGAVVATAEERSRVVSMVDVAVRGDVEESEDATVAWFKLGIGCASLGPHKRPSMKEVVQVLEKIQMGSQKALTM